MYQIFKIKKNFRYPFILAVVLLLALFFISLISGEVWEKIIVGILFLATLVIAIEASEREFAVSETGLRIRKYFRTKNFVWTEITHLGVAVLSNKAYFLLTTTKGFYIFSNLLQDHSRLIRHLTEKLESERVETEVKNYLDAPIERTSLVVMTWVAVGIIIAIILTKLLS